QAHRGNYFIALKGKFIVNSYNETSELKRRALPRPGRPFPFPLPLFAPGLVGRLDAAHLGLRGCVLVERVEGRFLRISRSSSSFFFMKSSREISVSSSSAIR